MSWGEKYWVSSLDPAERISWLGSALITVIPGPNRRLTRDNNALPADLPEAKWSDGRIHGGDRRRSSKAQHMKEPVLDDRSNRPQDEAACIVMGMA